MSLFSIPHPEACPDCARPAIELDGDYYCGNKSCDRFSEVVR